MGTKIIAKDVAFSRYIDVTQYPVATDLVALHYLTTDRATSNINHAPGFPGLNPSTTWGANVVYGENYAEFTGATNLADNHLNSQEADNASNDMTLMVIARQVTALTDQASWRLLYGVYGAAANSASIFSNNVFFGDGALRQVAHGVPDAPHADYQFFAATFDEAGSGLVRGFSGRGGVLRAGGQFVGKRVKSATTLRIGGHGTGFSGTARIAAVAKHRRALTDQQLQDIYFYWRSRFAKLGLTVA